MVSEAFPLGAQKCFCLSSQKNKNRNKENVLPGKKIVAKKIKNEKKKKKKKERKPFNGLPILHSAIIEFREH